MLKLFALTQAIPTALILLTANTAFSQPVSRSYKRPTPPVSDSNPPCYIQRADGKTLNLSSLCGKVITPSPLKNQSDDEEESSTLANQRKYETELNRLKNQRQKLPDTNTLINSICNFQGKCPSRLDNISVSNSNESP